MGEKQYGIIREQGEYMDPVPLSEEDNKKINKQDREEDNK